MRSLDNLRNRRIPIEEAHLQKFSSVKKAAVENKSYDWLVDSTQPIEEKYTNETFKQGDRVRDQLNGNLESKHCSKFEYQGSVTCDTHVKYHSDIDLLLLNGVYVTYPPDHPISHPVTDKVVADSLLLLRKDSAEILKVKFPQATVDESGSKAIAVSGGSLTRDIDVVFCNWWNTAEYIKYKVRANRGIKVLDASTCGRIGNKPFLHNWHINSKDNKVGGGLRKSIRLLKNLKYEKNPEANISSYDIAALSFNMEESDLNVMPGSYLSLAKNTSRYLNTLIRNTELRESLYVPNGTRKVFCNEGASLEKLKEITAELDTLLSEISLEEDYLIMLYEASDGLEKSAGWEETRASRVREVSTNFTQVD